ncbi:hypothetical protein EZV62_013831 [Acer yangbiense]|uniref:Protein kinase domain-containing protein n=1 Tax=Acer yangbiense TaxID=1000413 RepID=A0A5C7HR42_9ROSI|nr:hypothetical protein EZV62_013831 [Acer yangbiense]
MSGISGRDIKASNVHVFLDKDMNVRFCDFGLAGMHHHEQLATTTQVIGTAGYYMAPERLEQDKLASTQTDVFGFGFLVLEVVGQRRPIEDGKPNLLHWLCMLIELLSALNETLRSRAAEMGIILNAVHAYVLVLKQTISVSVKMAGRNRWTTRNPDDPYDSGQVDPGPDDCCCSWFKPKSKTEDTNREGKGKEYSKIKKNGKYTAPNTANVTKSKDQGYSSSEENNASHGGTRPEKTISSTVEQASTLKEIKNRQVVILEDQHKGVHKPEYNTGPDLTKKESSSPEQAAGVQKREGKQKETKGINNNGEQFKDC